MVQLYQRETLSTATPVGNPDVLPDDLFGLDDESLADVEAAVGHDAAAQLGYLDTGFFPTIPAVPSPDDVTQVQFQVAAHNLGFFTAIDTAAGVTGGETLIRWQTQVVLSETNDTWLVDLVVTDAGLTHADLDAIFSAAKVLPDALRSALVV